MQTKKTFLNRAGTTSCAAVAILAISFNLLFIGPTTAKSAIFSHASPITSNMAEPSSCPRIYLPTIFKSYPLPAPTPTPSIFRDRSDACYSPHGDVPSSCKIYSPDGKLYVAQLDSTNSTFGVFNACNNQQLRTFTGNADEPRNPLKSMSFSPKSDQVTLLYHKAGNMHNIVLTDELLDTPTSTPLVSFSSFPYHHYMVYLTDEYLALSPSGSEGEAIVYGIKNRKRCSLQEWRQNEEACP